LQYWNEMSNVRELSVETDEPDPVDIHVGQRIWQRRREMGLSRRALGEVIGVGLKQVNKYETAMNRVSGGRLYEIALALSVPVAWFFEGVDGEMSDIDAATDSTEGTADQQEIKALLAAYHRVSRDVRSKFLRLVRSIADDENS
jgi:transcriptional regulator with XRE-family HTH domain